MLKESKGIDLSCTQEVNIYCLLNKSMEMAKENKEAGLILAASLGTAIIINSISRAVTKIVRAWLRQE
jgi:hypothetical protein